MPIVEYACEPGKPTYGESHPIKHCVTQCQHRCMSPFLMAAIHNSNQRNHHKGRLLSATSLSGCARKLKLERTIPYSEFFKNLYYSFRGTVTHTVIENATEADLGGGETLLSLGYLSEWNMKIGFCFEHGGFPIPPDLDVDAPETWPSVCGCPGCDEAGVPRAAQTFFILTGTLDGTEPLWALFDPEEGTLYCYLHDVKTMQEYAVGYMVKGDEKNTLHPQIKNAYVYQAHVYKYLAEKSLPPEALAQRGVKRLRFVESHIQGFAMGQAPYTGSGTFRWKDHWKNPLKDWPMYPITFESDAWIETYIREGGVDIFDSLILDQSRGKVCPPEKSGKGSHSWACDFCAFAGSDYCPNPGLEWDLVQDGMSAEAAFDAALASPKYAPEEVAGALTESDVLNITNFLRRKNGEALVAITKEKKAPKEKAPPKPRAKRTTKKETADV